MKKTLGVVAAATLAAMPVMGVFAATTPLTDEIEIKINDNCAFSRKITSDNGGHSAESGHGTWAGDKLAKTMTAGTKDEALGSSDFNVICNNTYGYQVTMEATGLESENDDLIEYKAQVVTDTASSWAVHNGTNYVANNGVVKENEAETAATGDDFTVTYSVGLKNNQAAGTYEGKVVYTFAKLNS